ncbi:MAG: ThuA domain-containing protein [Rhodothermales bacterium]|nr:ThuA domain-containing protein [Rhodothermales bacterium]
MVAGRSILGVSLLVVALSIAMDTQAQDTDKKRVLAIFGDCCHRIAPLDNILVSGLRKQGWEAVVIIDYNVPWDEFDTFDLIIMSREGREYVDYYRTRDTHPQPAERGYWLTPAQEQKFEDYVNAGGRIFLYHDGFGNYECGNGVSRVARSCFISHPAIIENTVSPTGKMPELAEGITPFVVADEEYLVKMDESQTSVYLESHSEKNGRSPQAWAHPYGEGKVAVLIPGHNTETQNHPMIKRAIENIMTWLLAE